MASVGTGGRTLGGEVGRLLWAPCMDMILSWLQ